MPSFLKKNLWAPVFLGLMLASSIRPAYADSMGLIFRGAAKTVAAAFQIPAGMIQGSTQAFPLGLVAGAVTGTFKTIGGVLSGGLDMARGAAPYAKYMVFFM